MLEDRTIENIQNDAHRETKLLINEQFLEAYHMCTGNP